MKRWLLEQLRRWLIDHINSWLRPAPKPPVIEHEMDRPSVDPNHPQRPSDWLR